MKQIAIMFSIIVFLFLLVPSISLAQEKYRGDGEVETIDDNGIGDGDPIKNPEGDAPFDGGLSLLVAAGVAYGAKRAHSQRKKRKDIID